MKPRSAKQKGKALEDHVANRICELGLDPRAKRDGASGAGNREKADICTAIQIGGRTVGIECKNQKTIKLKEWWNQTRKLEELGREPILALKLPRESLSDTVVVMYLETLLELLAGNSESLEPITEKPEIKWRVKRAKDALHELFKVL